MIQVLYVSFHEKLPDDLWHQYLYRLPQVIRNKISRYVRWQDRHAGLFGKLLLLEGLQDYGYSPSCLERLSQNEFGRPFLSPETDFNISHSGEYAVCAISDKARVGIDVEAIRPVNLRHFQDHLTDGEWQAITTSGNPYETFYHYWTIKESVIKADGKGLSTPLSDVVIRDRKALLKETVWFLSELNLHPHYKCHLATNLEHSEIRIRKLSDHFLNGF